MFGGRKLTRVTGLGGCAALRKVLLEDCPNAINLNESIREPRGVRSTPCNWDELRVHTLDECGRMRARQSSNNIFTRIK